MNWVFWGATAAVILIFCSEWPKLKQKPFRDRATFVTLLLIAWVMFYFDLPHTPGPTQLLQALYNPLIKLLLE